MSFLKPTDSMILMNSNADIGGYGLTWYSMDTPELIRLRDECGFTVVEEQIFWHDVERLVGQYNWILPDKQVERVKRAGMKLILCAPDSVPSCLPPEWYLRYVGDTTSRNYLSIWNKEAQEYERNFLQEVIKRYGGADVSVIFHGFLGGESALENTATWFDHAALKDFEQKFGAGARPVDYTPSGRQYDPGELAEPTKTWLRDAVVARHVFIQEAFVGQHNELWCDLQLLIAWQSQSNGNFAQPWIHKAYRERWPDAEQWLLLYTYWGNGPDNAVYVDKLRADFGCKVIVEANYCEGLRDQPSTVPAAIAKGFQGQIVCPLHPFRGHATNEPWMIEIMKRANDQWKEHNQRRE